VNVLALDTATPYLTLGAFSGERSLLRGRRHAETLMGDLEEFLTWVGLRKEDLELLVVGVGPGSYTGLRVGAAAALGISRALKIPVVGVSTLAAMAARRPGLVRPALTARSGHLYTALYRVTDEVEELSPPTKLPAAELPQDACQLLDAPPSGRALARLGLNAYASGARDVRLIYL